MPLNLQKPEVSRRAKVFAFCGLAGALAFGVLPISHWFISGDSMAEMLAREAIWWCFALAILLWLKFAERLPLSSIGFRRPTWRSVVFAVLAAIVVMVAMVIQFAVIIPLFHLDSSAINAGARSGKAHIWAANPAMALPFAKSITCH
jgi:hypothetical protein